MDDNVAELTDVAATIVDIAGAAPLPGARGESLLARVHGQATAMRELSYSRIQSYAALRTAQYRFTMEMHSGAACELFDMNDDPAEVTNLVNDPSRTHLVEELKTALVDLQRG